MLHGVDLYRSRARRKYEPLFEKLADRQKPHTLMITCSDSRIDPGLITSTHPGELFVVRNVGNLVPKYGVDKDNSEQAALEYSLSVLNVKELIICGHSGCGAVQAMVNGVPLGIPGVSKWLTMTMGDNFLRTDNVDEASRANVLKQLENLMSYPVVREKIESGSLQVHAWFYEIKTGDVLSWNKESKTFASATEPKTCCVV